MTEDDPTWAQAECYEQNWCKLDGKSIKYQELYQELIDHIRNKRNRILDNIL